MEEKTELYLIRVQLINNWDGEEKITKSFDYQVSPRVTISQRPLFMRAEEFYNRLQSILRGSGGKVTVTDRGPK